MIVSLHLLFDVTTDNSLTDINECENATEICDGNATCSDTQGSYECMCNSGYSGDGLSCTSEYIEMNFQLMCISTFYRYQ